MNGQQHWIGVYNTRRWPKQAGFGASVSRIALGAAIISALALPLTIDIDDLALEDTMAAARNAVAGTFESAIEDLGLSELGSVGHIGR